MTIPDNFTTKAKGFCLSSTICLTMFSIRNTSHWRGAGGIGKLLPIALPMMLSSLFDTAMMFVDRLYLSRLGKTEMAACMSGGSASWSCMVFFVGLLAYSSALVARQYGAKNYAECPRTTIQTLRLAFWTYPLILLLALGVSRLFALGGHAELQVQQELRYFWICTIGCLFGLFRSPLASFFSGIGETAIIMWGNAVALVVNLVVNYALIYGKWGCPAMGIDGAAIGTVASSFTMTAILAWGVIRKFRQAPWRSETLFRPAPEVVKALLRFGYPSGLTGLLCSFSFTIDVLIFHGISVDAAAAMTIVMSWEMISFLPMNGLQIGVTSLTSQRLGAQDPAEAERAVYSGLKLAVAYSLLLSVLYLIFTTPMLRLFTGSDAALGYETLAHAATWMMRINCISVFCNGIYLIYSGGLQGGGDTFAAMLVNVLFTWFATFLMWFCIKILHLGIISTWLLWNLSYVIGIIAVWLRFRSGRWKNIKLLADA